MFPKARRSLAFIPLQHRFKAIASVLALEISQFHQDFRHCSRPEVTLKTDVGWQPP